jgi:tetratricopeptide (TPR) repeat protein/class 3 adenylate cyclase
MFVRFGGIDYDNDSDAGALLDTYIRWVQGVLAHYEGFLIQLTIGDKGSYLYAAFGAPIAHDDDASRAVAAALDLQGPPAALQFIQPVQIGLSRGRMRAGAYGGMTRRTYGALGDEVNMAARLMAKAEPGQILVSQRIADAIAPHYQLAAVGLVQVKGKQAPVSVSIVLGRQQPGFQQAVTRFASPLVGRDSEIARLDRVLDDAQAGSGQVLRLQGGAGIGKSRLAAAFSARAASRGMQVAVGACQSSRQDSSYAPWRQVFRTLFGLESAGDWDIEVGAPGTRPDPPAPIADPIAHIEARVAQVNPDWLLRLPLLGDLLALPIPDNPTTAAFEPRLRQVALFALAVDLLQAWARAGPLLVLIEDAHWMDESSRGLLLSLARVIARAPIALALVQRPPLREDRPLLPELNRLPYHQQIVLGELEPEGVAALVATRLGGQPDPLTLDLVLAQAQGHPFFTEELVHTLNELSRLQRQQDGTWTLSAATIRALRDAKCLVKDTARGTWALAPTAQLVVANLGIPDSVHGVVLSRIDRLPEEHKLTLKVASVIGHMFGYDVLAHAHPTQPDQDALLDQIDLLEDRDFARMELPPPQLTYSFKHSITQEVTYTTLLEAQQRELHLAVGVILEAMQPEAVETLAYHYHRSGVRDKLLFYLDQAARKAQREYANETALSYYQEALALEERWEWRKGQVEILHILGQREEEQDALRALETALHAPTFDVAYLWGQYHEAVGDYEAARAAVEQALAASRAQRDKIGEMRCLAQLGLIVRRQGDYERAKGWYMEALALFQSEETCSAEEAQALAKVLNGLGIVHREQGNFEQAGRCYEQAMKASRSNGDRKTEAEALNGLGVTAYYQRNFAEALNYHRAALEIRRTIGDRVGEGTSLFNIAIAIRDSGDYGQAQEYLLAALAIHQATGHRWEEVNVWNDLGILYQELGDLTEAQECLQRGLLLSQEIGDLAGQMYLLSNFGVTKRDQGDLDTAEKLLADGLKLAHKQDDTYQQSFFLSYISTVSLRAGRFDQAIGQANAALTMRRELGLRLWTTADLTTLAAAWLSLADLGQALDYARQALTLLNECGGQGPESPQQDYFICYQVLSAAGQAQNAEAALRAAYNLIMERAQKIHDSELRQSFLERVSINQQIMVEASRVLPLQPEDG